jgi:hypothetical protein
LLDQQRRAAHQPPIVELALPSDPRVRDLRVEPHRLDAYDDLASRPAADDDDDKAARDE